MTATDTQNTKANEEARPSDGFNLDGILSELGSFGKYQLLLLLLLSFRDSFLAMCQYNYVFAAAEVPFRCHVPECESLEYVEFNASWSRFALPNDTATCLRHTPQPWNLTEDLANDTLWSVREYCSSSSFHREQTVACDKIVYEDYNSIVAEFDLGCQPWKRALIGTVHNIGLIFSYVLSGFISDRYGRKVIIVGTPLMVGIAGILKSFSVNYWMLLVLEFLETALGYGNASLVLSLETVNQNSRVVYTSISECLSNFGAAFFGLIAWKVPYWRHMMRAIYAPLLVAVFYIFLVDEGVRWLLAHNKNDEAVRVLNKVAKMNNVTLSSKAKEMLDKITEEKAKSDEEDSKRPHEWSAMMDALRSRKMIIRVALISACFFCCILVVNGAIVNAVSISGNKFLNFSAMMLVSIPTRILSAYTLTRFGRKAPIFIAYLLCAICFVTSAFVPKSLSWMSVTLYVLGKMGSSYGTFAMFVVGVEAFPTTARNSLLNIASTVGRLGSVLSPQAPLLSQYMDGLPSVVFGAVALCACGLVLLLPETGGAPLPDRPRDLDEEKQSSERV